MNIFRTISDVDPWILKVIMARATIFGGLTNENRNQRLFPTTVDEKIFEGKTRIKMLTNYPTLSHTMNGDGDGSVLAMCMKSTGLTLILFRVKDKEGLQVCRI